MALDLLQDEVGPLARRYQAAPAAAGSILASRQLGRGCFPAASLVFYVKQTTSVHGSMSSLADAPDLVGFFSYSREDDEGSGGKLSKLRERIQEELRLQLGRTMKDFRLWQDKVAIAHGGLWEDRIKSAIAESVFFIPIITPTAVVSPYCKFEFDSFLAREKELGRSDLVFPIIYIPVPALTVDRWRQDPLLSIISSRQYVEWQNLRHLDPSSTEVALRVKKFCANICRALQEEWLSPEERQQAEAGRVAEAERRRQAKTQYQASVERARAGRDIVRTILGLEKEGAAKEAERRTRPSPRAVKSEYVVWYGTNRRRYDASDLTKGYSAERDSKVHYGSCRVYIPEAHKIGSLGSPWWKRLMTWTDDRLKLREIKEVSNTSFWHQIALRLSRLSVAERHAVIFVHGYNVSFHDAALRAAQIGVDLSIKGIVAFFSWPSQGSFGGYVADSASIEASEQDITNFMLDVVSRSGAEAVHIIAHSMGNRGVLRAVNRIAQQAQQRSGVPFGQIILAAADVDSDTFRLLSDAYAQVARRTTLYVSERDRAVEASHWLHQFPRVGLMPPVCVAHGIDTVGVTNVDLTLLGHGYIGDAREVLQDIHELITKGSPPEHRFGIKEQTTPSGERFWMLRR